MDETLELIVKLHDEASAGLAAVRREIAQVVEQANVGERSLGLLRDAFRGVLMGIGISAWNDVAAVFGRITQIIPDLIGRGMELAETVHHVSEQTGASAQQTSQFVGQLNFLGINVDSVSGKLGVFSTNVQKHEDELNQMGIATRDANGDLLNQIQLFDNVRSGLLGIADGTAKTALEQQLFGRSSQELVAYLHMTDAQVALLNQHLEDTGQVLNDEAVENARKASLAMNDLGGTIQGVANELIANVAPGIEAAVEGIAGFIHDNMANIVSFASQAVGFVIGLLNGLLGVNIQVGSFVDNWAAAGDAIGGVTTNTDAATAAQVHLNNEEQAAADSAKRYASDKAAFDAAQRSAHSGAMQGARDEKQAIEDQTKAIDNEIQAVHDLDEAQKRHFDNAMRGYDAQLQAELDALDSQDRQHQNAQTLLEDAQAITDAQVNGAQRVTDAQQRLTDAQGTLTDAQHRLTDSQNELNDAQNASPSIDWTQRSLDARQYALDVADANKRLADAQRSGDQDQVARAQLALDELTHRRQEALATQAADDARAAQAQQDSIDTAKKNVGDATDAVTKAQGEVTKSTDAVTGAQADASKAVSDAQAKQASDQAQIAEDAKRAEITATLTKLDAIAADEQNWTDKKGYLAQVQTDEASVESQIEAAKKIGDTQKVHDLTILLQGLQTIETRLQQELRNKDSEAALTAEKTRLEDLKTAIASATSGPSGLGPKFTAANVEAAASFDLSKVAGNTAMDAIKTAVGTGGGAGATGTGAVGAVGDLSGKTSGSPKGTLTTAFADAQTAGTNAAAAIKSAFSDAGTTISNLASVVAGINSAIGGVDFTKLLVMGAAMAALTGNLPLAAILLGAAGLNAASNLHSGMQLGNDQVPSTSDPYGGKGPMGPTFDSNGNYHPAGSPGDASSPDVSPPLGAHPHAGGLEYVPYDNYPALLHKGERVQTAADAARGGSGGETHFHVHLDSPAVFDPYGLGADQLASALGPAIGRYLDQQRMSYGR